MLNKKYIIGGVIILVIIAGAVFFSRNNSSTPDASVLEKGVKNLTREKAAEMIKTYLELKPSYDKIRQFNYYKQLEHFSFRGYFGGYIADSDVQMFRKLEQAGFVKIVEEKKGSYGDFNRVLELTFDFIEQAKPFFVKRESDTPDNKDVDVLLAELVSVEVTGLTEPAMEEGVNRRYANYTAKYKATPIGQIIDEKKASEEVKDRMSFILYDDGWRIGY